ncbi:hypothetical protein AJ78_06964 [Emergomyces pasteurianus Ep9510]|uniref:Uncharacterized protein n=1 Tax=Emergomyces pasteurianus Ep9510 TaxID=1447872 RepID=A0A1J9P720_9EURO|nr:hypothetical protein AJ78_06964 [Emergomyces pasteurianus Ep9510]
METRSDSSNNTTQHLCSSLPPHPWLNHSPVNSRGRNRLFDHSLTTTATTTTTSSPLEESTLARRTALRQLNGLPRPFQRNHRHSTSISSRSSLPSQPVVVRTYSAETDAQTRPSAMSRGTGVLANGSAADRPPAQLPPVHEFGIDGILRAIEPDIQNTLDAIAEICGRSKLSLANEYGSHRPPLGEIRASSRSIDHGLLPVEEASSSNERLVDQNVLILGEDTSTVDGRNPFSSTNRSLANAPEDTGVVIYGPAMPPAWGQNPFLQQNILSSRHLSSTEARHPPSSRTKEAKHSRHSFDWALLGREPEHSQQHRYSISTQPVVSEVHLDAQADGTYLMDTSWESYHRETSGQTEDYSVDPPMNDALVRIRAEKLSFLADLQGWLAWFRNIGHRLDQDGDSASCQTAEMRLREVLQRQDKCVSSSIISADVS